MPFQTLAMVCPPASVSRTVQPLRVAAPLLATVTSPWKPPLHTLAVRNVAVQAPGCSGTGGVLGGVFGGVLGGVLVPGTVVEAALRALRTEPYAALGLLLRSNSSGFSLPRQESLSRTPHVVMPTQRGTFAQAWVRPWYWLLDALVTSASVNATSTPRAAKLDSVCWKLPGSELPPVKWVCRPTQSTGTPRALKSLIML